MTCRSSLWRTRSETSRSHCGDSERTTIETVRKAMMAGARDFLARPVRPEILRESVLKAMEAEENRRLRKSGQLAAAPTAGTVITVFGAKGGIGKSTVATNLAVSLASSTDAAVCIVDLDNGFGDVCGMLDIKPEQTLVDLIRNIDKLDRDDLQRFAAKHELSGLNVFAAPSLLEWRKVDANDVRRVLEVLATQYDKIVLDTSGTLNDS